MDWPIWMGLEGTVAGDGYATSFFIPTIIEEIGFTAAMSQVRSIPIFIVAALCVAWATDRVKHRYEFTIAGVAVGGIGYVILLCENCMSTEVRYMACFFITTGGYMTQPVTWVWLNNNMGGHYKRSIATAMQIGIGNAGGIVASNVFITNQSPQYPVGYGVSLGMLLICGFMCTVFFFGLKAEIANMGDDHPEFRYTT